MNAIKIKINKLGMIGESAEITLSRFMVFSGESGLGKSYLSIICHYIFAVLLDENRISSYFTENGYDFSKLRDEYHGSGTAISISKADFEQWLSKDAIVWLGYMIKNKNVQGDIHITLPDNIPSNIEMTYEEEISELGNNVETYIKLNLPYLTYTIKDSKGINEESPYAYLFRYYLIQQIFGDFRSLNENIILPPSRGTMLTEIVEPTTGMYVEFKKNIQKLATAKPNRIEVSERLNNLLKRVLDGEVSKKDGQYYYYTNGSEMPLSAAAASIRELASFEFLVENADISKTAIMIDEPEAHLHPLKQRTMAEIVCCLVSSGAHVQLTTHSDYFLRRLNELVMKFQIRTLSENSNDNEYVDVCKQLSEDPDLFMNPNLVSAYLLKRSETNPMSSVIINQDMTRGVPFSSFHEAIDNSLKIKHILENKLSDANC